MANLQGKVALVTGATRGIGKGIAVGLGEAGATVYITGRSIDQINSGPEFPGNLTETCCAVEEAGGRCIPIQVDHSQDDQIECLFQRIRDEQNGQLDVLVNNAFSGVSALRSSYGTTFWESDPSLWDACNQVGLRSHYMASIQAAKLMTPRREGLICMISSWGGLSYIFGAAYGAGKAACDRLAADMAVELRPYNVACLSIWPGIVGTEQMIQAGADLTKTTEVDPKQTAFRERYNWETPLLTGRVMAALAAEPSVMSRTGRIQIVAEIARQYQLVDGDGNRPVSLRSLRFLLPFTFPGLRKYSWLLPDVYVPWMILLLKALNSPQIS